MQTMYSRSASVEAAPLERECILFHPGANRFFVLNDTAAFIWSMLETANTVAEIATKLRGAFSGVTPERAEADVRAALEQMLELTVVEIAEPIPSE